MAKIFQLELFIKEMSLWTLPQESEDHDETLVEVTVFDMHNVPINGYVFGKNTTMNQGQNFLFTLDAVPVDDNKVSFIVFKKAYNREKKFLGNGNIPIDKIFGDLFSQVFKDSTATNTPGIGSKKNRQDMNASSQRNAQPPKMTASQTKVNGNAASKNNPPPSAKQNPPQSDVNANVASTNDPQDAAKIPAIKNLKTVNIGAVRQGSPTSGLSKDVYPIIGSDSRQWGTICILMRLTCFGISNAHPILIHQNHKEIILQNTPKSATYKCVPLEQSHKRNDPRKKKRPTNYGTDLAVTSSSSCGANSTSSNDTVSKRTPNKKSLRRANLAKLNMSSSSLSNGSSSSSDDTINPCPGPPGSPNGQYEEFTAEVNDNILCVRVPKNAGSVKRIYDSQPSAKKMDSIKSEYTDRRKIPIIRGNRKYPAHYGTTSSLPSPPNSPICNRINENRICRNDNISCPSNVQITRRNNDPRRDVFLLNIGKDARTGNGIQLEMKTPKNPLAGSITNKQTTSVQTYDDEFVGGVKSGKGGKGGKKGGKKGKK